MDEQDFKKRNTDCVYFLASPLTCKKGLECEYRHSEMARLNPTDCRYWLDRGCSNLACPFRHPPLEGRTGAEAESADPSYGVARPVTKKNVACYYFFNYFFCKNGDRCQFLHGDEVNTHDWIPSKALSGEKYVVAPEKKITTQSNSESTLLKKHPSISLTTPFGATVIQHKPITDFQQSAINNVVSNEDVPAGRLDSLGPAQDQTDTDQSFEEHLEGLLEREELLELSPGFDVLVGGKSQNLDYDDDDDDDDDDDYLFGLGGEDSENDVKLVGYGYNENSVKYNPDYPKLGVQYEEYEEQIHDSYGGLNTISGDYRDRSFDHISSRKRKSMQMEPAFNDRRDVDLRDLLKKKRRTTNGHGGTYFTRGNELSRPIVQRRESERPRWQVYNEFKSFHNKFNQRVKFRRAHINGHHLREKRHTTRQHLISSQLSSRSAPRERSSTEKSSTFTGPKTLDQIKEEKKKKSQENGKSLWVIGHSVFSGPASESFKGPKPLDKLLKKKRRLGSVVSRSENCS